jgi:hypothetical protein
LVGNIIAIKKLAIANSTFESFALQKSVIFCTEKMSNGCQENKLLELLPYFVLVDVGNNVAF